MAATDAVLVRYLQQQATVIHRLQQASGTAGTPVPKGVIFKHEADDATALGAVALTIAGIHAIYAVYTAVAAHRAAASRQTRQYLQLDSLAPDEYDVQRLESDDGGFL